MSKLVVAAECSRIEITRYEGTTRVFFENGDDCLLHVDVTGSPDVYATGFDGKTDRLEDKPTVRKPRVGKDTRARIIKLLSNGEFTVRDLITFLPKVNKQSTVWTAFNDLKNEGIEIKKRSSPYGGRERSFWIEAS